jgi:hypothetical protein
MAIKKRVRKRLRQVLKVLTDLIQLALAIMKIVKAVS